MLRSEEMVRELAYALWDRDGRPDGLSQHYWLLAECQLAVAAAPAVKRVPARKASVEKAPAAAKKAPARRAKVTA